MEGGGEGALGTNPDEGEYLLCYIFVLSEVPAVNIIRKMWLPPVQDSLAILLLGLSLSDHFFRIFRYFPMSIEAVNHIASTKFVNPYHDISQPQKWAASLPSSLLSNRWISQIREENACKTQNPVTQGAVAVASSANPLLSRPLTGRYWLKRSSSTNSDPPASGSCLLPLSLWPAAPPLPVAKKSRCVKKSWRCNKDLGEKSRTQFLGQVSGIGQTDLFRLILQMKWRIKESEERERRNEKNSERTRERVRNTFSPLVPYR